MAQVHGPFYLDEPLTRTDLSELAETIADLFSNLEAEHGKPLYLPFQLRADGIRAAQGYLTKMPADLVAILPGLPDLHDDVPVGLFAPSASSEKDPPGHEYRDVQVGPQVDRDPFSVDPAVVERALKSHADLQNHHASLVVEAGFEPRSPAPLDPPWDLFWLSCDQAWVAEVKILTRANEERQLRLGLGQVLIYRHRLLRRYPEVVAVLMLSGCLLILTGMPFAKTLGCACCGPTLLLPRS